MGAKVLATLCVFVYAGVVPLLEVNATHVFDPAWTPHARLHEVWQLATNTGLGLFSLWLIWRRKDVRLASVLAIFITGGFLFAYGLRGAYDGSMVLSDGSEKTVAGFNLGVVSFGLVQLISLVILLYRPKMESPQAHALLP